jgi:hypothetical protein
MAAQSSPRATGLVYDQENIVLLRNGIQETVTAKQLLHFFENLKMSDISNDMLDQTLVLYILGDSAIRDKDEQWIPLKTVMLEWELSGDDFRFSVPVPPEHRLDRNGRRLFNRDRSVISYPNTQSQSTQSQSTPSPSAPSPSAPSQILNIPDNGGEPFMQRNKRPKIDQETPSGNLQIEELSEGQILQLLRHIKQMVTDGKITPEQARNQANELLASFDGGIRKQARWLAAAAPQNKSSIRK